MKINIEFSCRLRCLHKLIVACLLDHIPFNEKRIEIKFDEKIFFFLIDCERNFSPLPFQFEIKNEKFRKLVFVKAFKASFSTIK
jgi:hypothetical protein